MKTASAKAKGRRAAQEAREAILFHFTDLAPDDVIVTSSGACGEDLRLSGLAQQYLPFAFEVKNQERLNVWEAWKQAESHALKTGRKPALIYRRNRGELMVSLRLNDWLEGLK